MVSTHFGMYHQKKPEQIRVVFDSSTEYQGKSLNREWLTGQDLMNSLVGVLIRFREKMLRRCVMWSRCSIRSMFRQNTVTS